MLHLCCAPCAIVPLSALKVRGVKTLGFFFNPNIHPLTEYNRRLETLSNYARESELSLVIAGEYGLQEFLRAVVYREEERCLLCYRMRLTAAAKEANACGADAFSTTLLYSVHQKHEQIKAVGEAVSRTEAVDFYYEDFRPAWREGVQQSRELGMYRQPYCGCIYSEMERYRKPKAAAEKRRAVGPAVWD
ncbi:MAG: epoxyqueuosine reductase QueH [bacterium]|nr:epoxyqueuosine reductase QueH [bacterium]